MKIARIVSSNSHIEYIARVVDPLDASNPPGHEDYGFGTFVAVEAGAERIVGVVFNSMLINPDYSGFGPRLSSSDELETFSPDFLDEQGSLLAILLLGRFGKNDGAVQGIPLPVVPAGSDVLSLSEEEIHEFHRDPNGKVSMKYFSQVVNHAGIFAAPLLEKIISDLSEGNVSDEADIKRLAVLRRSLVWQRTVGQMRL